MQAEEAVPLTPQQFLAGVFLGAALGGVLAALVQGFGWWLDEGGD